MKRGNCRYCLKRIALTKAGLVRRHYITRDALGPHGREAVCGGSGALPV